MRIGLAVYGTTFSMGLHPASSRPRSNAQQLLDQARAANLQGVEIPVSLLEGEDIPSVARAARERGLFITLATGGYTAGPLTEAIHLGAQLGAETVRTVVGGAKIGGDRSPLTGRWQPFLQDVLTQLKEASAMAEQAQVKSRSRESSRPCFGGTSLVVRIHWFHTLRYHLRYRESPRNG